MEKHNHLNKDRILASLQEIRTSNGQVLTDRIDSVIIKNGKIGFAINIDGLSLEDGKFLQDRAKRVLKNIFGLDSVNIALTSKKNGHSKSKNYINGVRSILLVAAGKGGVGKSTIASMLARYGNLLGKKIGILDADIYGPSIPQIFGISGRPEVVDNKMIPLDSNGMKINSIGFLTDPEKSISWRGPMTTKAIYQLLSATHWGELDLLIIDMPPGTGDIHLSILENYHVDNVLMVTTPDILSKIDVVRSINLYKKFDINILGIVENMSYLETESGEKQNLFSGNAGQEISEESGIPLLDKIPLVPNVNYKHEPEYIFLKKIFKQLL